MKKETDHGVYPRLDEEEWIIGKRKHRGNPITPIRLNPIVRERLQKHAAANDVSVSDVIRRAIDLYFRYREPD